MANLLTLRRRIRVAGNIAKTTRAMQMVAASKMRRAQESALKGRPYTERLTQVAQNLIGRVEDYTHPYLAAQTSGKPLIIIFSPDKGLCGALISNLARELVNFPDFKKASFITVGKKLSRWTYENLIADFSTGVGVSPTFEQIPPIVSIINTGFLKEDFEKVYLLYAKFISFFTQKATLEPILPIEFGEKISGPNYVFEPTVNSILDSLLSHYLESKLYQILLESYASEQAARMLAMQNATENAREVIKLLTLEYNKVRQAKITDEILDNTRASLALVET